MHYDARICSQGQIFSSLKITFCKNGDAKRKSTQFYFKISIILKFEYFTEMYAYQTNIYVRVLKTRQIHEFTNYKKINLQITA